MSWLYSEEELAELFEYEGLTSSLTEGWIQPRLIPSGELADAIEDAYEALKAFQEAVAKADEIYENN